MIDLHTHSTYSDGSDTPSVLARRAREAGLHAIALTDHDTIDGHEEMAAACAAEGVEFVPGLEVSLRDTEFPKRLPDGSTIARNVHVLAYFVPADRSQPIHERLAELRADRDVRNVELVAVLRQQGFTRLDLDYLAGLAGSVHSVGRPHFARAMFELHPEIVGPRTVDSWNQLFRDWLGVDGRAYIPKASITVASFLEAVAGSGVVVSIAHPLDNYLDDQPLSAASRVMPDVLESLRARGVIGVEAYYGSLDEATRQLMAHLARQAGLVPTGGSDYHGSYKADIALGRGRTGDLAVPDSVLDELRRAHAAALAAWAQGARRAAAP